MKIPDPNSETAATLIHIRRVNQLLLRVVCNLADRAACHDTSKLQEPERSLFELSTQRLAGLTYGSEEYRASLDQIKPAITHHYAQNSHHPEHFVNGISGMSLMDLIEMLVDWKAATERHNDGSLQKSLEHNKTRFSISDQLMDILQATVIELGLDKEEL